MRIQLALAAAVIALSMTACDKEGKPAPKDPPAVALGDLSTSLAAARTEFNAHRGEPRFLTLLSPT